MIAMQYCFTTGHSLDYTLNVMDVVLKLETTGHWSLATGLWPHMTLTDRYHLLNHHAFTHAWTLTREVIKLSLKLLYIENIA